MNAGRVDGPCTRDAVCKPAQRAQEAELTVVGVGFDAEAVLHAADPRSLVLGSRQRAATDAVAALDASRPLAVVDPATVRLPAKAVTSTVGPLARVRVTCTDQRFIYRLKPNSTALSGRRQVRSWSQTCSELEFGLSSSSQAAS